MHFFSFHMTDDLKRICFQSGHRYILFSITGHADGQGVPLYQAVCSGDNQSALGAAAMWHYDGYGRREDVRAYVVYETEEVREGIELGEQERKAGSN
jgi:hypothetical protein